MKHKPKLGFLGSGTRLHAKAYTRWLAACICILWPAGACMHNFAQKP